MTPNLPHHIRRLRDRLSSFRDGARYAFFYGLATDLWLFLFLGFLALSGVDMLLPTFVSARINLGIMFGALLISFAALASCPPAERYRRAHSPTFLTILSAAVVIWGLAGFALSVIKFPPLVGVIIFAGTALVGVLFIRELKKSGSGPEA